MRVDVLPIKPGLFTTDDPRVEAAALRGSRCARCGETFFPPRRVCPRCRIFGTMRDVALGVRGRIVAATYVVRVPAHYRTPYVLAEIDLDESVRILAQVEGPDGTQPKVGDEVKLVVAPLFTTPEGAQVYGYHARSAGTRERR